MNCPSCGAPATGSRFCGECGTPLQRTCPGCGAPQTGSRFCGECGFALATAAPAASPPSQPAAPVAERRITSVLFGDLVSFTTLSEARDPEDVRELLSRYFATARLVVERYGGTVEKFIGDAVMAVWGVPTSHEDDAERAVRAGLDLTTAVADLGEQLGAPGLAMRVGVVTGEVAVTLGATGEGMVAGDAVNTAARVQAAAGSGEVWVDEQTRNLTAAAVAYVDAGRHELKGKAEPVELWVARHVVATVGGSQRVDGLEAPFTGRDRDLRLVKELFHATLEEQRPRLVAVSGVAGVGKSRLGWEFEKYIDGISQPVAWHRGRCLSYGDGVAFWSLAEMVRSRLGIIDGEGQPQVADRLASGLTALASDPAERDWLLPRLAALIGVTGVAEEHSREELFAAWRLFFELVAVGREGVVLLLEDLQWADEALLDFLEQLVDSSRSPIFVLTFARPELAERRPAWGSGRRATGLTLEPLADAAMADLVDGLVAGLPQQARETLMLRAEGVPLYAVETVRALIDRDLVVPREGRYVLADSSLGAADLADLAMPTSLQTLIAARLDALPAAERRTVQDAAVLGQSFSRAGLVALREGEPADDLDELLGSLVRKEIFSVDTDPRSPERGQYHFVQAMVRTVAYDTLARRDRKARHLTAAAHLAGEPDADSFPAVLASHYLDARAAGPQDPDAAELATRAAVLLEEAAIRARALAAPAEARRHFTTAIELSSDDATRGRLLEGAAGCAIMLGDAAEAQELATRAEQAFTAAGMPVDAGRACAVVGEALVRLGEPDRAKELLLPTFEALDGVAGAEPALLPLARWLAAAHAYADGYEPAHPWYERAMVIAENTENWSQMAVLLAAYSVGQGILGRSTAAIALLRGGLEVAREHGLQQAQILPLNNLAASIWPRDLAASRDYAEEGLALATRLRDASGVATLSLTRMTSAYVSGEWDRALELSDVFRTAPSAVALMSAVYERLLLSARGNADWRELPQHELSSADVLAALSRTMLDALRSARDGDLPGAVRDARAAVLRYREQGGLDDDFPVFWTTAVEIAGEGGDEAVARELLELVLAAPRGRVSPYLRAQLPRFLALVDAMAGEPDRVEANLTEAIRLLRAFGAPFELGKAQLQLGQWLAQQGRGAEATPLLDEAERAFGQLRAAPWIERARSARALAVR